MCLWPHFCEKDTILHTGLIVLLVTDMHIGSKTSDLLYSDQMEFFLGKILQNYLLVRRPEHVKEKSIEVGSQTVTIA